MVTFVNLFNFWLSCDTIDVNNGEEFYQLSERNTGKTTLSPFIANLIFGSVIICKVSIECRDFEDLDTQRLRSLLESAFPSHIIKYFFNDSL